MHIANRNGNNFLKNPRYNLIGWLYTNYGCQGDLYLHHKTGIFTFQQTCHKGTVWSCVCTYIRPTVCVCIVCHCWSVGPLSKWVVLGWNNLQCGPDHMLIKKKKCIYLCLAQHRQCCSYNVLVCRLMHAILAVIGMSGLLGFMLSRCWPSCSINVMWQDSCKACLRACFALLGLTLSVPSQAIACWTIA